MVTLMFDPKDFASLMGSHLGVGCLPEAVPDHDRSCPDCCFHSFHYYSGGRSEGEGEEDDNDDDGGGILF